MPSPSDRTVFNFPKCLLYVGPFLSVLSNRCGPPGLSSIHLSQNKSPCLPQMNVSPHVPPFHHWPGTPRPQHVGPLVPLSSPLSIHRIPTREDLASYSFPSSLAFFKFAKNPVRNNFFLLSDRAHWLALVQVPCESVIPLSFPSKIFQR